MKSSFSFIKTLLLLIINTTLVCLLGWLVMIVVGSILQLCRHGQYFVTTLTVVMQENLNYLNGFSHIQSVYNHLLQWCTLPALDTDSLTHSSLVNAISWQSTFTDSILPALHVYFSIFIFCSHLILVKLALILGSWPLLLFISVMAFSDGLIARSLRRYQGIRESALIYHQSLKFSSLIYYTILLLFLLLPIAITPSKLFLVGYLLLGGCIWLATKQFKKYL